MVHFLRIDSLIAVIYLLKEVGKITRFNPFLVRLSRASNEKKKKLKQIVSIMVLLRNSVYVQIT